MAKRYTTFWFSAVILSLLVACGGGGGGDRAAGVEPGPESPGGAVPPPDPVVPGPVGYSDANEIFAFITSAGIDGGQAVVEFQLSDENNTAILDLESGDVRFILAKLQGSELGNNTGSWQSYVNKIEDPSPDVGNGTESRLQATTERNGDLTSNGDGSYSYRFATDVNNPDPLILAQAESEGLDLGYEPDRTHRVSIQFSNGPNPVNPWYDWEPASGNTSNIFHQNISATNNCNRCHEKLALHGGGRIEIEYCVTCHNPGSTDANSTNTVDFKVMVHKIHMGESLPSVEAGGEYTIYGFDNRRHDYSHVVYPQDTRNCQNCHVGTATTNDFYPAVQLTNDGDNWNEFPSRAACGSCHDNVVWENHFGGQADDSRCGSCHSEGGGLGSIASSHVMLVRDEGARYVSTVESVENAGPGEFPSVDIRVTNPETEADYDILNDAPFTNDGASLNVKLAWATTDYTNTGNGEENASDISQSALSTATPNGDGSFRVEFEKAIPDGSEAPGIAASGSGAAVIDGHPTVIFQAGQDPVQIPIRDANFFFSIDEASGQAEDRRIIVADENCLTCHQNLDLHGNNRSDNVESCVTCHNPRNSDRGVREIAANPPTDGKQEESINFTTMVHAIHAAGYRENALQVVGFRGFSTHVYDEEHVQYPGRLSNCNTCHVDGSFNLPLSNTALGTSIDTGADRTDPTDDLVITPASAACSSCHDSDVAQGHMESNGGHFATSQAAIDSGEVLEQCELCHGSGRSADISELHGLD